MEILFVCVGLVYWFYLLKGISLFYRDRDRFYEEKLTNVSLVVLLAVLQVIVVTQLLFITSPMIHVTLGLFSSLVVVGILFALVVLHDQNKKVSNVVRESSETGNGTVDTLKGDSDHDRKE